MLEGLVDNCRNVFGLGPNDPIILSDMRDAHRVLVCAARLASRHGGTPATTSRRPAAVASPAATGPSRKPVAAASPAAARASK